MFSDVERSGSCPLRKGQQVGLAVVGTNAGRVNSVERVPTMPPRKFAGRDTGGRR